MSLWDSITNKPLIARLEKELEEAKMQTGALRASHRDEIKTLREEHRSDLQYARDEILRVNGELERTRLFLNPELGKPEVSTATEGPELPFEKLVAMGTPWQRVMAREIAAQDEAVKNKHTVPASTVAPEAQQENVNANQPSAD